VMVATGTMKCDRGFFDSATFADAAEDGEYVYVEVTDTGAGISPKVASRMFDPFFSTKIRGKGLGLAVVLGIVRAHAGAITVVSAPGKGSTFRALFPVEGPKSCFL
jgi:two-component system, cell cycle sensor histidine kinase and response regulator CckA